MCPGGTPLQLGHDIWPACCTTSCFCMTGSPPSFSKGGGWQLSPRSLWPHPFCGCRLSLNVFMHWWRFAMEVCISMWPSSTLLITSVILSSDFLADLSILDVSSSQISLSSDLVVRWQRTECDREQSSLSFHLLRWYALFWSLGGSWPDPSLAVSSGTAFPLPLSGGTMSYSHLTSLMLGDSCAPAFDPPPAGGGVVVVLWSAMLLVLSSWDCELTVMPVRFAPDCTPMLLYNHLGHTTFCCTIGYHYCEAPLIILHCDKLLSSLLLQ